MCGIVYMKSFRNKNVTNKILNRYQAQRNRGTSGFGFYLPGADRLTHNANENRIIKLLKQQVTSEALFHHRFPTSTDNVRNACHPFSTKKTFEHNYVLVHNGVVTNSRTLKADHDLQGIEYVSMQADQRFNDSEALLYDVALYLEGKQDKLKARGSIAFVCIENDKDGNPLKLHFGRNDGSPLKMTFTNKEIVLASEGLGQEVVPDKLYSFDYATQKLDVIDLEIPDYYYYNSQNYGIGFQYESLGEAPIYNNAGYAWSEKHQDWRSTKDILDSGDQTLNIRLLESSLKVHEQNILSRAYKYASNVMEDNGNDYEKAWNSIENHLDSVDGKLIRLNSQLRGSIQGTNRHKELANMQLSLVTERSVLEEALDLIMEMITDDEAWNQSTLIEGEAANA